jgi:hypothetical protein
MTITVPYISDEVIERDAAALLADFAQLRGVTIALPIPIEEIVEKHLKLGIEFDDTHRLFGVPRPERRPDILGALFFDKARIVIDESLDPDQDPDKEGRYRFTLAHEGGGHWRLHRHLFANNHAQTSLFGGPATPPVVCRSSQKRRREELQADLYASCLLMPLKFVLAAWDEEFPDRKPRIIKPSTPIEHPYVEVSRVEWSFCGIDHIETETETLDHIARPLAERFLVSTTAMRIRLEKLGLLLREVPHQRSLA